MVQRFVGADLPKRIRRRCVKIGEHGKGDDEIRKRREKERERARTWGKRNEERIRD